MASHPTHQQRTALFAERRRAKETTMSSQEPPMRDPQPAATSPIPPAPASEDRETTFQARVNPWLIACFGEAIARDRIERNHRFIEEALELVQSNGCTREEAHQLVEYVFDRPGGDLEQEVGGVMNTLAALCLAIGLDMHEAGELELARVWTKVEQIRAKQAAKPKHSPLPATAITRTDSDNNMADPPSDDEIIDAIKLALYSGMRASGLSRNRAVLVTELRTYMPPDCLVVTVDRRRFLVLVDVDQGQDPEGEGDIG